MRILTKFRDQIHPPKKISIVMAIAAILIIPSYRVQASETDLTTTAIKVGINNQAVGIVQDQQTLNKIINRIKGPYIAKGFNNIRFAEKVTISKTNINKNQVLSLDEAVSLWTQGTHSVKEGENLWSISQKFNKPFQSIQELNPKRGDQILLGEKIVVTPKQARLNVIYSANNIKVLNTIQKSSFNISNKQSNFIWPTDGGKISSGFGYRWSKLHKGIDISRSNTLDVQAANSGQVIYAGYRKDYGNLVIVSHKNNLTTHYAHNKKLLVKKGALVRKGQSIAIMGSTGHSTGVHLHFELRKNGKPVNPLLYVKKSV